jgi:hypothetical protein
VARLPVDIANMQAIGLGSLIATKLSMSYIALGTLVAYDQWLLGARRLRH